MPLARCGVPIAPASVSEPYVCTLDSVSLLKAKDELNEHPKERMGQIQALRTWIEEQPQLKVQTNDRFLLCYLRSSKFSQLRARQMVKNGLEALVTAPEWFRHIDPLDDKLSDIIDKGYCIPLPKKTKEGCRILLYRIAALPPDPVKYSFTDLIRSGILTASFTSLDEAVQIHGHVFVFDYTGVTMKHLNNIKLDDMKKWNKIWQKNIPGRFKGFHFYNAGNLFQAVAALVKPFLNKKYQNRFHVHNTAEGLAKAVGAECLPDEYLPDDREGQGAGSIKQIIKTYAETVQSDNFRQLVLYNSHEYWSIDDKLKQPVDTAQASFRKLAVD